MLKMVFRGYGQFEGELALGLENPLEYWGAGRRRSDGVLLDEA